MIRRSLYVLLGLLIVSSMLLGACAPSEPAAPAEPVEPVEPAEPAEPVEPAEPKTFIFGRGGDSIQLDPSIVTDGESFRVTGQILEPLYQYEHGTTTAIPALATGCTANADSSEWT